MTQEIKIKRKEGDEMSFKLRKSESLVNYILESWNGGGFSKTMTEQNNKKFGTNEDYKSEKIQKRLYNVIERILKVTFSETDISEYPILWNEYMNFKEQTKGKKQLHFDKLSEESKFVLLRIFSSQLSGGKIFPKGVWEGTKLLNNGKESTILISKDTYESQLEKCKEKGFSTQHDKYGEESRIELYSDGTLFEVDTCRPCLTLGMLEKKNPNYLDGLVCGNKIQKEVSDFYKEKGRSLEEFFEKCWVTKMESFHMMFEKDYGKKKGGKRKYWNLKGIKPLCEHLGFEILSDDTIHFLPIDIPKGTPKDFKLFKHFPHFEKMYNETDREGIRFMVTPNRLLEGMIDYNERSKKKEEETVG